MDEKELQLIYIHKVGEDWNGSYIYQFLFTTEIDNADGEQWDSVPASSNPEPPSSHLVKEEGLLISSKKFDLLMDSTENCYWDGVDGFVAIAMENLDDYETYPDDRLGFMFGETIKVVKDRLCEHDLHLKCTKYERKIRTKEEDSE